MRSPRSLSIIERPIKATSRRNNRQDSVRYIAACVLRDEISARRKIVRSENPANSLPSNEISPGRPFELVKLIVQNVDSHCRWKPMGEAQRLSVNHSCWLQPCTRSVRSVDHSEWQPGWR